MYVCRSSAIQEVREATGELRITVEALFRVCKFLCAKQGIPRPVSADDDTPGSVFITSPEMAVRALLFGELSGLDARAIGRHGVKLHTDAWYKNSGDEAFRALKFRYRRDATMRRVMETARTYSTAGPLQLVHTGRPGKWTGTIKEGGGEG